MKTGAPRIAASGTTRAKQRRGASPSVEPTAPPALEFFFQTMILSLVSLYYMIHTKISGFSTNLAALFYTSIRMFPFLKISNKISGLYW